MDESDAAKECEKLTTVKLDITTVNEYNLSIAALSNSGEVYLSLYHNDYYIGRFNLHDLVRAYVLDTNSGDEEVTTLEEMKEGFSIRSEDLQEIAKLSRAFDKINTDLFEATTNCEVDF